MADLGQPPRFIGNIQTAIGCGTIRRASGIAVRGTIGDPVREGDVIEVEAGGRIEIRLIGGRVLDLPGGTCLELSACAQDPNEIARPGLLARTRDIFRSIGSWLARSGTPAADPPVGNFRAGGFGTLTLTALTFSLLKEARAAESNVTFLDDDSINYKDLHHGVFELVTKEAIPRHIIVEDPGETIILSRKGSSVGVSQATNSPSHMQELREAQQETLAYFEKGPGSKGSGTSTFDGSPLLQPINFQPGAQPLTPDPLAPVPVVIFANVETFKPPPVPPHLNLGAGLTEIDTAKFDDFGTASGTFSASSKNGAVTFGIGGGSAGNVVQGQLTYDVSSTGAFGTLYLNSETGNYTFVPNNAAINALKVNSTQSFVITVSDGTLSTSESFDIPIVGVDDASIISGAKAGAVVGAVGVSGASPGLLIATGTLTDTDVDDPANTFTAINAPTTSAGGHGSFTLTTAGVWTYTLNNADSSVQALHVGQTLTDSFTVATIGGTPQVVTITIHGPLIEARPAPSLTLSETHLTATALDDNIAGSAPDAALTTTSGEFSAAFVTAPGVTASYALTITGGNGAASGLIDSHTGLSDVLVLNGNTIEGRVGTAGGALAFTIAVDPATGRVTFVEHRAVEQSSGTSPDNGEGIALETGIVNLIATVTDSDGRYQDISIDLGKQLTITDDGPHIAAAGTAPSLTLSETHLTATALDDHIAGSAPDAALTTTSADFSAAFTSVQGADGATIRYALTITGGNGAASGLIDSHTGLADLLVLNGNTIEGRVGATNGTLAFTITLDPATGRVTFTDYRPVEQPLGTSPDSDEAISLAAGIVNLTATITDRDGDFQSANLDLGSRLSISDDGPCIRANGTAPSLTLSETHLTATALDGHIAGSAPDAALTTISADFSTAFTSLQGADGATTHYALTINGGNCTPSGLTDSHTGLADVLVQHGNTIEGHVGTASGELAFTIAVDPATGSVTFTEYRAVTHPSCTSADEAVSLTAGVVNLVATITDKDGDFQTACIDLGKQLTITDDHPTICGFPETFVTARDDQTATGTYHVDFGADGDAAMRVAVHDGAVGCTGYDLATSCLGDGVTSVHVTGHGDDYSFYYTTHQVGGGVELDAYLADCGGTLADPYFRLLISPDGTYCFDLEHAGPSKDVTVSGSDFDAPPCGTPSLTAPDGQLVITGSDCAGHPLDVKASSCGIAVGDSGLQMDPAEQLNLAFTGQQSQVSFNLTQWQGYGTAGVILKVLDGSSDVHDFCIDVPKPLCGSASFVVQETSDASLIDTYTFNATTTTYTLYVDRAFNQVQVDYDRAEAGHPTFAVNNISYTEKTSINADLLFDVTAVDGDGDSATTNLQVDIQCHTAGMDAFTFAASPDSAAPPVGGSTSAPAPDVSPTSTSGHVDAALSQAMLPFVDGGTSATTGQSFHFAAELPSLEQQGASPPPDFDQTATWFGYHQDSAGFRLAQGAADGAPATGPAIPEHQPDYFSNHMPDAVVTHTPHDLIV
ncbi:DUF5801 repeats-in-toxin domain-containing protein [Bradyrhizobium sp. 6(2017)]|uniref:DUF5801 repeats-in-toxin domain-containing protein n=1 Tax=Bradyrhizobium sp. 6(2017) TaxID=1197460 RepID=UPI0013E1988A|nr:DUF5801 repeats-in-toxin domain-containing protein [Bradyrhizobium sp. 6(2017)]QIG97073.1 hypothetical protein G6P99_34855 [Bradyrhizobium sp. 6(2017)]